MSLKDALLKLVLREDLSRDEARAAMRSLVDGEATPSQIAAFAIALRMKGETPEEIAGLAEVMREAATRVHAGDAVVDVVGTGGDGAGTFNISTVSALVVASAGGRVAKHGNRSITSACGAADFLEAIGVAIDLPPSGVARCIDETGFGFMFAPLYHPAMKYAGVPRREIGVRTVFNILGPLANPAGARRQLTGVAAPGLGESVARVLDLLGAEHAVVVHGQDGLDEISVCAPTQVPQARGGCVRLAAHQSRSRAGGSRVILDEILAHKRREVAERRSRRPLEVLEAALSLSRSDTRDAPLQTGKALRNLEIGSCADRAVVSSHSFSAALRQPGVSVIAEFKRRSPSGGELRPGASAAEIARIYLDNGAAALSILTDQVYFGGTDADLVEAREASGLPVLNKDFVVDPYQVYEACALGPDAVLLIVRALTEAELG